MAVSSGNITDELIAKYIEDQEGSRLTTINFKLIPVYNPPAYSCGLLSVEKGRGEISTRAVVLKWIRKERALIDEPEIPSTIKEMEFDEM
jgi:hypothetical protein